MQSAVICSTLTEELVAFSGECIVQRLQALKEKEVLFCKPLLEQLKLIKSSSTIYKSKPGKKYKLVS